MFSKLAKSEQKLLFCSSLRRLNINVLVNLVNIAHFLGLLPSSDRLTINKVYHTDMKLSGVEYTILNAALCDAGTYECLASNMHGNATKKVRVGVTAVSPSG